MIGIAGVCISAYGLYMRREQLMGYFNKKEEVKPKIVEPVKKREDDSASKSRVDNEVKEGKKNKKVVFTD